MENEPWIFPHIEELDESIKNDEVCVVGVFGKGTWGHTSKNLLINTATNTSVFPSVYPDYIKSQNHDIQFDPVTAQPKIEGYYDKANRILYLHLTTTFDAGHLADVCTALGNSLTTHKENHDFWKQQEINTVMSLVYLFSISHLLLLVHPVSTFDISYDRLFHHINSMRNKLLPLVKETLKECSVGRDWWVHGRPCPPRLLIIMMRCHLKKFSLKTELNTYENSSSKKKKQHLPPLKKLEYKLEDQVYTILRHSRVLTNNAVNNLFTVPLNQMYIHIMTDQFNKVKDDDDPIKNMLQQLKKSCEVHRDPTTKPRAYKLLVNPPTEWKDVDKVDSNNTLLNFIKVHTKLVLEKKGFKDSGGRNPVLAHFEIPQLKNWMRVANKLHELFFTQGMIDDVVEEDHETTVSNRIKEVKNQILIQLDPESHFSEARCSKLVTLATATYQNGLPSHYTSKVHSNQLTQALAMYSLHARGPSCDKYEQILKDQCEGFWNDGRRLCEVRSLTGRHCIHRFHLLPEDSKSEPNSSLTTIPHSSRSRSIAASNCGRMQFPREDPFTLKEANNDFYAIVATKTPALDPDDIFKFPVYQLKNGEENGSKLEMSEYMEDLSSSAIEVNMSELMLEEEVADVGKDEEEEEDCKEEEEVDSLTTKLSQNSSSTTQVDLSPYIFSLSQDIDANFKSTSFSEDEDTKEKFTEGMIHSLTPEGALPLFNSWSLVRIGSSSSYDPLKGLEMQGIVQGSNFLAPWIIDLPQEDTSASNWPAPSETKKISLKDIKVSSYRKSVVAYLGYEYETLRGQRFLFSAHDKMIKSSSIAGSNPESVQALLEDDMPIFKHISRAPPPHAPTRPSKTLIGQLMRIFIVTPDECSVKISIKPQVVSGLTPSLSFYPSQREIQLRHNSIWVLRLPYVYMGENGTQSHGSHLKDHSHWKILKMISLNFDNNNSSNLD